MIEIKTTVSSEVTTIIIDNERDKETLSRIIDEKLENGPVRVTFG